MDLSEQGHLGEQGPYESLKVGSSDPTCYEYSSSEIFSYNYWIWMVGFILGLNFTHLDEGPLENFTLDIEDIKQWGVGMWIFCACVVLLLGSFLIDLLVHYFKIGYMRYYILLGVIIYGVVSYFNSKN